MTKYPNFEIVHDQREGLDELILQGNVIIDNMATYNEIYSYFLTDLRQTGLRFNELLNKSYVLNFNENNVEFMTEKGSNNRIIKTNEFTPYFQNYLLNEQSKYFTTSIPSFYIIYNRCNFPWIIKHNKKWLSTHVFRHIKAKKLYFEGYTRKQIQEYFSEVDIKNSDGYIDSYLEFYKYVLKE